MQKGKVRVSVVSKPGKEATIDILNEGDFFGESCLAGQTLRMCSATAMTACTVMRIDKKSIMAAEIMLWAESRLGNSGPFEKTNEDDALVKWDDDGRTRQHQPSLKKA